MECGGGAVFMKDLCDERKRYLCVYCSKCQSFETLAAAKKFTVVGKCCGA